MKFKSIRKKKSALKKIVLICKDAEKSGIKCFRDLAETFLTNYKLDIDYDSVILLNEFFIEHRPTAHGLSQDIIFNTYINLIKEILIQDNILRYLNLSMLELPNLPKSSNEDYNKNFNHITKCFKVQIECLEIMQDIKLKNIKTFTFPGNVI